MYLSSLRSWKGVGFLFSPPLFLTLLTLLSLFLSLILPSCHLLSLPFPLSPTLLTIPPSLCPSFSLLILSSPHPATF